ncbi:MAG: AMP-binding protein, partial [Candidatus Methylomirabilis sp.]|nr:AMP-binding protein [Deltaproteobacteria bacterium]
SKLGAVGALINTNLRDKPLAHAIGVARPRKVLAGGEHADAVREVIGEVEGVRPDHDFFVQMEEGTSEGSEAGPIANKSLDVASRKEWADKRKPIADETYCYIYTSGTTGLPKAAIITNRRMVTAATLFGEAMIEGAPGDVIYIALPLYHSSAMYIGWGSALRTGAAVALRKKFSASNFWKDVGDYGATSFLYIGELCRYLLNTPTQPGESAHKLRVAVGNGLRPDIWEPFQRRFNIPTIREFYGATEGNAPVLNFEGRPGMIGRRRMGQVIVKADLATGEPIRNAKGFCEEIEVGETGLLLGKITKVLKFDGYVDGAATKKKILENVFQKGDQYFNSGDLIVLHDNGWLAFGDRVGDTFRWKGENVSTNEVAEVLNKADGVLES